MMHPVPDGIEEWVFLAGIVLMPIAGAIIARAWTLVHDGRDERRGAWRRTSWQVGLLWALVYAPLIREGMVPVAVLSIPVLAPATVGGAFKLCEAFGDSDISAWKSSSGMVLLVGYVPQIVLLLWQYS